MSRAEVTEPDEDRRSLDPCWVCGEKPTVKLSGRWPTCEDHLHTPQESIGACEHCGGGVWVKDDYVGLAGAAYYHRGCAERLRDDLDAVLLTGAGHRRTWDRWTDARYDRVDVVMTALFTIGVMALVTGWLCR